MKHIAIILAVLIGFSAVAKEKLTTPDGVKFGSSMAQIQALYPEARNMGKDNSGDMRLVLTGKKTMGYDSLITFRFAQDKLKGIWISLPEAATEFVVQEFAEKYGKATKVVNGASYWSEGDLIVTIGPLSDDKNEVFGVMLAFDSGKYLELKTPGTEFIQKK